MIEVLYREYRLKIFDKSYIKREFRKPWVEPNFCCFDAELWSGEVPLGIIEITWDEQENFLHIRRACDKEGRFYRDIAFVKNFENNFYKVNYELKEEFKIDDPKFDFVPLLNFAKQKLIENLIDKRKLKVYKTKFLYEPFILHSSPVILVSPMGLGKSIFCYWLAFRIQNGFPLILKDQIFDNYCEPKRVVYLSFEGNEEEIEEKIRAIKRGYEENEKVLFEKEIEDFYHEYFTFPFSSYLARKRLREIISVIEPDLIIIDSVTTALLAQSELKQADYLFNYIKTILEPRNIAILLIMHPSKADLREELITPKGPTIYMANPRIVWGLDRIGEFENGFQIQIKSIKDNLGLNKTSYKFTVNFKSKFVENEDGIESQELIDIKFVELVDESLELSTISQKCLEYLKEKETASIEEIANYYKLNDKIVATILARLVKSNKVVRVGRGRYALKEEGKDIKNKLVPGNDENIPF